MESGSHNLANVQEEAPTRKERARQTLEPGCLRAPPAPGDSWEDSKNLPFPSRGATGFFFKDVGILSWLLG